MNASPDSTPASADVLVTGGAGFVGANLAHRLLHRGHRVRVLDNLSRPGVEHNLRWLRATHGVRLQVVEADVRDAAAIERAIAGVRAVCHFAAQVAVTASLEDPVHDFTVNALGTLNLLEAARALRAPPRLLFTSTNKVYGSLEDVGLVRERDRYEPVDPRLAACGIDERRPLALSSPYGCSKGAADQYVLDYARSYGLDTAVLRMSCIYGPRQFGTEDQGWVAHFALRALQDEPITIYGDGCQVRDILHVDDLVSALNALLGLPGRLDGRVFNVGGGPRNAVSLREVLRRLETLIGHPPRASFEDWRIGDQRYYVSDTGRLATACGWRPEIAAADGIADLLRWLRSDARRTAVASRDALDA